MDYWKKICSIISSQITLIIIRKRVVNHYYDSFLWITAEEQLPGNWGLKITGIRSGRYNLSRVKKPEAENLGNHIERTGRSASHAASSFRGWCWTAAAQESRGNKCWTREFVLFIYYTGMPTSAARVPTNFILHFFFFRFYFFFSL